MPSKSWDIDVGSGRAAVVLWLSDSFTWAFRTAEFSQLSANTNMARERAEHLLGIQLPREHLDLLLLSLPSLLLSFLILPTLSPPFYSLLAPGKMGWIPWATEVQRALAWRTGCALLSQSPAL